MSATASRYQALGPDTSYWGDQLGWRGILVAGNNVSGVRLFVNTLLDGGYLMDRTPRPSTREPTFTVINDDELWLYGLCYRKLYVAGATPITPMQDHWADTIVDAYDYQAMEKVVLQLGLKIKE